MMMMMMMIVVVVVLVLEILDKPLVYSNSPLLKYDRRGGGMEPVFFLSAAENRKECATAYNSICNSSMYMRIDYMNI